MDSKQTEHQVIEPGSSQTSPTVTPPRKITLGVIDVTNIKCTNLNRKRRWDQGPGNEELPTSHLDKKISNVSIKSDSLCGNEVVSEKLSVVSGSSCANSDLFSSVSSSSQNIELNKPPFQNQHKTQILDTSEAEIKRKVNQENADLLRSMTCSPTYDEEVKEDINKKILENQDDSAEEEGKIMEVDETTKMMEIIHAETQDLDTVDENNQLVEESVVIDSVELGEVNTITIGKSNKHIVTEVINTESQSTSSTTDDISEEKDTVIISENVYDSNEMLNESDKNLDGANVLSECINVSESEPSQDNDPGIEEKSLSTKMVSSSVWDQDSSDKSDGDNNQLSITVGRSFEEGLSKSEHVIDSRKNCMGMENFFLEESKSSDSQYTGVEDIAEASYQKEKDVLLSKGNDESQLSSKSESLSADNILMKSTELDFSNKGLNDDSGENPDSLPPLIPSMSGLSNKIVEVSSDQDDLEETEVLEADNDKDSGDNMEDNSIKMSSADNVDPAVMEIIFGIHAKPLTVSNSNEAYPTLQSPKPKISSIVSSDYLELGDSNQSFDALESNMSDSVKDDHTSGVDEDDSVGLVESKLEIAKKVKSDRGFLEEDDESIENSNVKIVNEVILGDECESMEEDSRDKIESCKIDNVNQVIFGGGCEDVSISNCSDNIEDISDEKEHQVSKEVLCLETNPFSNVASIEKGSLEQKFVFGINQENSQSGVVSSTESTNEEKIELSNDEPENKNVPKRKVVSKIKGSVEISRNENEVELSKVINFDTQNENISDNKVMKGIFDPIEPEECSEDAHLGATEENKSKKLALNNIEGEIEETKGNSDFNIEVIREDKEAVIFTEEQDIIIEEKEIAMEVEEEENEYVIEGEKEDVMEEEQEEIVKGEQEGIMEEGKYFIKEEVKKDIIEKRGEVKDLVDKETEEKPLPFEEIEENKEEEKPVIHEEVKENEEQKSLLFEEVEENKEEEKPLLHEEMEENKEEKALPYKEVCENKDGEKSLLFEQVEENKEQKSLLFEEVEENKAEEKSLLHEEVEENKEEKPVLYEEVEEKALLEKELEKTKKKEEKTLLGKISLEKVVLDEKVEKNKEENTLLDELVEENKALIYEEIEENKEEEIALLDEEMINNKKEEVALLDEEMEKNKEEEIALVDVEMEENKEEKIALQDEEIEEKIALLDEDVKENDNAKASLNLKIEGNEEKKIAMLNEKVEENYKTEALLDEEIEERALIDEEVENKAERALLKEELESEEERALLKEEVENKEERALLKEEVENKEERILLDEEVENKEERALLKEEVESKEERALLDEELEENKEEEIALLDEEMEENKEEEIALINEELVKNNEEDKVLLDEEVEENIEEAKTLLDEGTEENTKEIAVLGEEVEENIALLDEEIEEVNEDEIALLNEELEEKKEEYKAFPDKEDDGNKRSKNRLDEKLEEKTLLDKVVDKNKEAENKMLMEELENKDISEEVIMEEIEAEEVIMEEIEEEGLIMEDKEELTLEEEGIIMGDKEEVILEEEEVVIEDKEEVILEEEEVVMVDNEKEEIVIEDSEKEELVMEDSEKEKFAMEGSEKEELAMEEKEKVELVMEDKEKGELLMEDNEKEELLMEDNEKEETVTVRKEKNIILAKGAEEGLGNVVEEESKENKAVEGIEDKKEVVIEEDHAKEKQYIMDKYNTVETEEILIDNSSDQDNSFEEIIEEECEIVDESNLATPDTIDESKDITKSDDPKGLDKPQEIFEITEIDNKVASCKDIEIQEEETEDIGSVDQVVIQDGENEEEYAIDDDNSDQNDFITIEELDDDTEENGEGETLQKETEPGSLGKDKELFDEKEAYSDKGMCMIETSELNDSKLNSRTKFDIKGNKYKSITEASFGEIKHNENKDEFDSSRDHLKGGQEAGSNENITFEIESTKEDLLKSSTQGIFDPNPVEQNDKNKQEHITVNISDSKTAAVNKMEEAVRKEIDCDMSDTEDSVASVIDNTVKHKKIENRLILEKELTNKSEHQFIAESINKNAESLNILKDEKLIDTGASTYNPAIDIKDKKVEAVEVKSENITVVNEPIAKLDKAGGVETLLRKALSAKKDFSELPVKSSFKRETAKDPKPYVPSSQPVQVQHNLLKSVNVMQASLKQKDTQATSSKTVDTSSDPEIESKNIPLLTVSKNHPLQDVSGSKKRDLHSNLTKNSEYSSSLSSNIQSTASVPPKLEPITLRIFKDNLTVRTDLDSPKKSRSPKLTPELKSQLSPHLKIVENKSQSSPQSKQLEFTLKIAKDATSNYPKATMSPKSMPSPGGTSWKQTDLSRVEKISKESSAPCSPDQKMNKITLKLPKDGGHPEIKTQESALPNSDLTLHRKGEFEFDKNETPPEKKIKLDHSSDLEMDVECKEESDPNELMELDQSAGEETPIKIEPVNEVIIETPPAPVQKKRGRPRKIVAIPRECLDSSEEQFSVPTFDMSGSSLDGGSPGDNVHRPMRSCRGRTKPIVVRTRKPRGGGITRGGGRGRGAIRQPSAADMDSLSAYELAELAKIEARKEKLKADRIAKIEAKKAKVLAKKLKDEERRKRIAREKAEAQALQVFEEETRMSAPDSSRAHTPGPGRVNLSVGAGEFGEESQGSISNTPTSNHNKKGRMEIPLDPECKEVRVDQLAEYQWQGSELFMIQEQISLYLGVKSFKRKYPDLKRRAVEAEERTFLEESGLVPKAMCDLGLTAVSSAEVLDIMFHDFPDKYEEFRKHVREKQAREASSKQKAFAYSSSSSKFKVEPREHAIESAAIWNANLNRDRKEDRRCSLDLQTFSIHYPKSKHSSMTKSTPKLGKYPVAVIPGQFCDHYKTYTSAELRYFPVNTVIYGPMRPNERQKMEESEASQSNSDDSSSSDDSSDSSSEGSEGSNVGDDAKCKLCSGNKKKNKLGQSESMIKCAQCECKIHPTCQDLTSEMVPHLKKYSWQCTDCKTCIQCKDPANEDKMLFCDLCDRGYHIYCVGLRTVPEGRWHCTECCVCSSCNTRDPGGPEWQHEYKKGEKGTKVYLKTLCLPCSKAWRKGKYCQICMKSHSFKPEEEPGLQQCNTCERYVHKECFLSRVGMTSKILSNGFQCHICQQRVQSAIKSTSNDNRPLIKV